MQAREKISPIVMMYVGSSTYYFTCSTNELEYVYDTGIENEESDILLTTCIILNDECLNNPNLNRPLFYIDDNKLKISFSDTKEALNNGLMLRGDENTWDTLPVNQDIETSQATITEESTKFEEDVTSIWKSANDFEVANSSDELDPEIKALFTQIENESNSLNCSTQTTADENNTINIPDGGMALPEKLNVTCNIGKKYLFNLSEDGTYYILQKTQPIKDFILITQAALRDKFYMHPQGQILKNSIFTTDRGSNIIKLLSFDYLYLAHTFSNMRKFIYTECNSATRIVSYASMLADTSALVAGSKLKMINFLKNQAEDARIIDPKFIPIYSKIYLGVNQFKNVFELKENNTKYISNEAWSNTISSIFGTVAIFKGKNTEVRVNRQKDSPSLTIQEYISCHDDNLVNVHPEATLVTFYSLSSKKLIDASISSQNISPSPPINLNDSSYSKLIADIRAKFQFSTSASKVISPEEFIKRKREEREKDEARKNQKPRIG